jgi:hypothetical protein
MVAAEAVLMLNGHVLLKLNGHALLNVPWQGR